jgi:glycosyltransferase 2 family protein
MASPGRRRAVGLGALKILVTAVLVTWVFSRIDLRELAANLRASLGFWLLAAVLVGLVNITLGAVRWRLMLAALGSPFPLGEAVRLVWSGLFFNTFLPTSVVGDALRGSWAARLSGPAQAYWSVILDRVTAAGALTLVVAVGFFFPEARALPAAPPIAAACLLIGLPCLLAVAAPDRFASLLVRLGGERMRRALEGKITEARPPGPRLKVLAVAAVVHLLMVVDCALIARAAHLDLPVGVLIAVVPTVLLASYLPVSISGIGVRDVALVELLGQVGVPRASALTVSVLILAVSIVLSLGGGLVYLLSRLSHRHREKSTVASSVESKVGPGRV